MLVHFFNYIDVQVGRCEGINDRIKYCVLMCGDDSDIEVVKAASGALAMLTEVICRNFI